MSTALTPDGKQYYKLLYNIATSPDFSGTLSDFVMDKLKYLTGQTARNDINPAEAMKFIRKNDANLFNTKGAKYADFLKSLSPEGRLVLDREMQYAPTGSLWQKMYNAIPLKPDVAANTYNARGETEHKLSYPLPEVPRRDMTPEEHSNYKNYVQQHHNYFSTLRENIGIMESSSASTKTKEEMFSPNTALGGFYDTTLNHKLHKVRHLFGGPLHNPPSLEDLGYKADYEEQWRRNGYTPEDINGFVDDDYKVYREDIDNPINQQVKNMRSGENFANFRPPKPTHPLPSTNTTHPHPLPSTNTTHPHPLPSTNTTHPRPLPSAPHQGSALYDFGSGFFGLAGVDAVLALFEEEERTDPAVLLFAQTVISLTGANSYVNRYTIVPLVWSARKLSAASGINIGDALWQTLGWKKEDKPYNANNRRKRRNTRRRRHF
jgi:hypothetical protein